MRLFPWLESRLRSLKGGGLRLGLPQHLGFAPGAKARARLGLKQERNKALQPGKLTFNTF